MTVNSEILLKRFMRNESCFVLQSQPFRLLVVTKKTNREKMVRPNPLYVVPASEILMKQAKNVPLYGLMEPR